MPSNKSEPRICTWSGKTVNPMALKKSDVNINDIAAGLANQSRFAGQSMYFYSVAQHSVMMVRALRHAAHHPDHHEDMSDVTNYAMAFLLHDSDEAYMGGDLPHPIKVMTALGALWQKEQRKICRTVFDAHGVMVEPDAQLIQTWDHIMLASEAPLLIRGYKREQWDLLREEPEQWLIRMLLDAGFWTPEQARLQFLRTYQQIMGR